MFLGFFIIECALKIFVMGFALGPKTYLADGWNRLDFFIVIVGCTDLIVTNAA